MSSLKNVLIIGASGNLGTPILDLALKEPSLKVTVLTREDSKSTFPSGVTVRKADYSSQSSLVEAFKGQDVVVSVIGFGAIADQNRLLDAAVEAGVKRFYPSEYGSGDPQNEEIYTEFYSRCGMPGKVEAWKHLKQLSDAGKIEYTAFANGPFFDWGLRVNFLGFDLKAHKATIYNDGNEIIAYSNLAYIAKGVVYALTHAEESKNKTYKIYSYRKTQNELLSIIEKVTGQKFSVEHVDNDELIKTGEEEIKNGNYHGGMKVLVGFVFDKQNKYDSNFDRNDLPFEDDTTIEEVIKSLI